jgi:uncharacterized protein YcbX
MAGEACHPRHSTGSGRGVGEYFEDATDDNSRVVEWNMPAGRFVDTYPLLVLTTSSLQAGARALPSAVWDVRRFRPNLLVDTDDEGWVEDGWRGQCLGVGPAQLLIEDGCSRCTMVTRGQPGIDPDLDVYRALARHHGATFGVGASVVVGGTIDLLDTIVLARQAGSRPGNRPPCSRTRAQ